MTTQNVVEFIIKATDQASVTLFDVAGNADLAFAAFKEGAQSAAQSLDTLKEVGSAVFDGLTGDTSRLGDALKPIPVVGEAIGGIVNELGAMADAVIRDVEAFDKLGKTTGASIEFLSGFTQAADDVGVASGSVSVALETLSRKLGGVEGMGEGSGVSGALAKLGISATDAEGGLKSLESLVPEIADAFAQMPDGANKAAIAVELFGKNGADLIPILNLGADGMRENMAAAREMGLVYDTELREAVVELKAAQDELGDQWGALTTQIGASVVPALLTVVKGLNEGQKAYRDLGREIRQTDTFSAEMINKLGAMAAAEADAASKARFLASEQRSAARVADEHARSVLDAARAADEFEMAMTEAGEASAEAARKEREHTAALDAYADGAERVKEAMRSSKPAFDEATAVAAAYAAAIQSAEERVRGLSGAVGGSGAALDQFGKRMAAWKLQSGEMSVKQFEEMRTVEALNAAYNAGQLTLGQWTQRMGELTSGTKSANDILRDLGTIGIKAAKEMDGVIVAVGKAGESTVTFDDGIKGITRTVDNSTAANKAHVQALAALEVQQDKTRKGVNELEAAHKAGKISAEQLAAGKLALNNQLKSSEENVRKAEKAVKNAVQTQIVYVQTVKEAEGRTVQYNQRTLEKGMADDGAAGAAGRNAEKTGAMGKSAETARPKIEGAAREMGGLARKAEDAGGAVDDLGRTFTNLPTYKRLDIDVWTTYHTINRNEKPVGGYDPEAEFRNGRANRAFKGAP